MDEVGLLREALKWVALVFVAGFVGYFGKYLGIEIISFFSKKKGNPEKESPKKREIQQPYETGRSVSAAGRDRPGKSPQNKAASILEASSVLKTKDERKAIKKREKEQAKLKKKSGKTVIKKQKNHPDVS